VTRRTRLRWRTRGGWRRWASLGFSLLSWPGALALVMLSGAWVVSGSSYDADLVANLAPQVLLLLVAPALAVWLVARRWALAGVAGVALVVGLFPIVTGRAAWIPRSPDPAGPDRATDPALVRVLHYNDGVRGTPELYDRLIAGANADVVSMLSPPVPVQVDVIMGNGLEDRYPGKIVREWRPEQNDTSTRVTPAFVVSRWPITPFDLTMIGEDAEQVLAGVVERPGGPFGFIALHPRSPRNVTRWLYGNHVTQSAAKVARAMEAQGLPVVIAGDFNSTPSGWRSRELWRSAGLRRAKPVLALTGTYPKEIPLSRFGRGLPGRYVKAAWPLHIAIDDLMVSETVRVRAWGVQEPESWQHGPVTVDVSVPMRSP
jgi:endonuclease/exonuclease/phosphatase (EEP) superfamily protein YafD